MLRGEVIGVLGVKREETANWADEEVAAVEAVADQIAAEISALEASKGVNALPKVITIVRDTVKLKESEASGKIEEVKTPSGEMMKLGVITLPSFYMDFQAAMNHEDFKSSTKDVKKIIDSCLSGRSATYQ